MHVNSFITRKTQIFNLLHQSTFFTSRILHKRKCKSKQINNAHYKHLARHFWTGKTESRIFSSKCTSTHASISYLQRSNKSNHKCSSGLSTRATSCTHQSSESKRTAESVIMAKKYHKTPVFQIIQKYKFINKHLLRAVFASLNTRKSSKTYMLTFSTSIHFTECASRNKNKQWPCLKTRNLKTIIINWSVHHTFGIPYSPTLKKPHHTLKSLLNKQKWGEAKATSQMHLNKAPYVLNFLNWSFTELHPPIIRHFSNINK